MIRYPNRFHASETPFAVGGVEENYREDESRKAEKRHERRNAETPGVRGPRFDFTAINAVLGH